ncbi:MAG: hypothetical protein ACREVJ_12925, partial [Gammaproteobacteria bacterium]
MSAVITRLKPLWMRWIADRHLTLREGRYRALIDNVQAQNRRLWRLVVFLVLLLSLAVYGLHRARQTLPPVHIPRSCASGPRSLGGGAPAQRLHVRGV